MDPTHRLLAPVGKTVHRLGLALNYGLDEAGALHAFDRGVNYLFVGGAMRSPPAGVKKVMLADRERFVFVSGPTLGYFGGSVRRACDTALRTLGVEYIDVFQLFWLGVTSAYTESTAEELRKLKEAGKIRAIGVSIHDRPRAGKLAEDSAIDLFMLRYNAAHPGAERDVFPHLEKRHPAVVAYTATSWRKLLKAPSGWTRPPMTAGDCYRFCLSHPAVDLVLSGPASKAQLDENLAAVEKGPLTEEELTWMREYGRRVHG